MCKWRAAASGKACPACIHGPAFCSAGFSMPCSSPAPCPISRTSSRNGCDRSCRVCRKFPIRPWWPSGLPTNLATWRPEPRSGAYACPTRATTAPMSSGAHPHATRASAASVKATSIPRPASESPHATRWAVSSSSVSTSSSTTCRWCGAGGLRAQPRCSCSSPLSAASSPTRRSSLISSPFAGASDSARGWTRTTRCRCSGCRSIS